MQVVGNKAASLVVILQEEDKISMSSHGLGNYFFRQLTERRGNSQKIHLPRTAYFQFHSEPGSSFFGVGFLEELLLQPIKRLQMEEQPGKKRIK